MQFAREQPNANSIAKYESESIWIHGQQYSGSLALSADKILGDWQCHSVADLTPGHMDALLALDPEVIVIATGAAPQFPPAPLLHPVMHRGVGIEVMNDGAAVRTFNILLSEARQAALALIRPGGAD
ncbi:MAG: MTH938/NDUFAF3 family protein [Pseudomonadota bacterium]